jgi:DNA processing protein
MSTIDSEDGVRLTDEERLDWLRLIRSENVGPRGIMAQTPQAGWSAIFTYWPGVTGHDSADAPQRLLSRSNRPYGIMAQTHLCRS